MSETRALVKPANTAERVAASLRRAISSGELVAGGHVLQEEWALRLGVSRAPIREAMKMLVAERLLTYDTHRGYFVAELNPDEMSQVYLARTLLEREILRTIRWPSADELEILKKLATKAVEYLVADDVHGALEAARSLQFAIFDLSPLTLLVTEVKRYWGMTELYRSLSMEESLMMDPSASQLRRHHGEIFNALTAHNRKRLIDHNTRWREVVVARFSSRPSKASSGDPSAVG